MSHIHMVVAMEKTFGIRFDDDELQRVVRVSDLVEIIQRRVSGA